MRSIKLITKYKHLTYFIMLVIIALTTIGTDDLHVVAQSPSQWSPQARIPDYDDLILTAPHLVADQNRTVHAFNTQTMEDEAVIVYRQWTLEQGWTTPIDIILPPNNRYPASGVMLDVFLDDMGTAHMVFSAGDGEKNDIYYTHAPLAIAGQAPAWSTPIIVGPQASPRVPQVALSGDGKNNLFILYNSDKDGNGLYATHSSDGNNNWSEPTPIFLTYNDDVQPFSIAMQRSKRGNIYAMWGLANPQATSDAVYFSKLGADQEIWDEPIELAPAVGYYGSTPQLVEYEDELFVTYHDDLPTTSWFRRTSDGGRTWSPAVKFAPGYVGSNGAVSFVIDSNNTLHALFGNRTGDIHGMWHRTWSGGQWGSVEPVVSGPQIVDKIGGNGFDPNGARAVISQGNILLVTWITDGAAGENGAWYSYKVLDAPELPVEPLPVPTAMPTPTAPVLSTSTNISSTPTAIPQSVLRDQNINLTEAPSTSNPATPLVFGIAPVVLLIALVIVVHRLFFYTR